jgi:catechol 2,3-dioxygenase-like lactoylglutathione lyase family enzyme
MPLGLQRRVLTPDGGPPGRCWVQSGRALPRLYVYRPFDAQPASVGNFGMVAFLAPSVASVDAAYAAGIAAGGRDDAAPGLRPRYGAGYYGAYLRDPEGNKVHLVYRGDLVAAGMSSNDGSGVPL